MLVRINHLLVFIAFSASLSLTGKNPGHDHGHKITALPLDNKLSRATDILDFNAISDGRHVYVNWASGNEKNYDYYTIEKAKDGIHFETSAMIKGSGTTENLVDYIDIDYSPYAGISYYRLKQTDYEGNASYSDVVSVNYQFSKDATIISCRDQDPIDLQEVTAREILVVLRDGTGQEYVSKIVLSSVIGGISATDPKNKLKPGNYKVIASSFNRLFSQDLTIR